MIGQSNHDAQTKGRDSKMDEGTSSESTNNPALANYPQVDMHTLEESIVSKVRNELESVMTTVEIKVQDAVLTAIESSVVLEVELPMNSAKASSGRSNNGDVIKPDQR